MDIDLASSSYSHAIGQEDCIQKEYQRYDDAYLSTKAASNAANEDGLSGPLPEGPESVPNRRKISERRQSTSATMIEFLPLPVTSNLESFSTGI